MDGCYVSLPSNTPNPAYSNTPGDYKIPLPETLKFDVPGWEVALCEVSYPKSLEPDKEMLTPPAYLNLANSVTMRFYYPKMKPMSAPHFKISDATDYETGECRDALRGWRDRAEDKWGDNFDVVMAFTLVLDTSNIATANDVLREMLRLSSIVTTPRTRLYAEREANGGIYIGYRQQLEGFMTIYGGLEIVKLLELNIREQVRTPPWYTHYSELPVTCSPKMVTREDFRYPEKADFIQSFNLFCDVIPEQIMGNKHAPLLTQVVVENPISAMCRREYKHPF